MTQLLIDWESFERRAVLELWTPEEIFQQARPELLKRLYEDNRAERKPVGFRAEQLAKYICMWANTPPDGGLTFIGVEDDGRVSGCTSKGEEFVATERRIRCDLVPEAVFETKRVLATNIDGNSDFVTVIRTKYREDKVVETNKGEAYIRRADTLHLLTENEKRELQIDRGQHSFELESCGLKWPTDFDQGAIREWVTNVKKLKNIAADPVPHEFLVNHKLGKMQNGIFVPNNACALLFANDPQDVVPGCMIRVQRIEGHEAATGRERNVVKDVQITGTIPRIIAETWKVLETHLRVYSRLGADGKFYTSPEYPEDAWHEAIVNACVHRSYSLKGANIFVKMFDDRLVIESPGGFPATVTPDNIYENHYRRNWWLMDGMFYLEYVKCEHEGARRIRDAMKEMQLPAPEFEQKQVGGSIVRVTLRNNQNLRQKWVDSDVSDIIGPERSQKLSDVQKRIINFVVEHGKINASQAQNFLAKPRWGTAKLQLKKLEKMGILKHVSNRVRDPNSHFVFVDEIEKSRRSEDEEFDI